MLTFAQRLRGTFQQQAKRVYRDTWDTSTRARARPISDDEFQALRTGMMTPEEFPEDQRGAMTQTFFERLIAEHPHEWQQLFDSAADQFTCRMKTENGRASVYNPRGRRFKRKQIKLMANQWAFDAMGVNHSEHAETADELLNRAETMAEVGAVLRLLAS